MRFGNPWNMVSVVSKMENGNILKKYITDPKKRNQKVVLRHWTREITALRKVSGWNHFPRMISFDAAKKEIVLSDCGDRIEHDTVPQNWYAQCREIMASLKLAGLFHNDIFLKNITVKDGTIYLVDFGLAGPCPEKHNDLFGTMTRGLKL